ncbi:Uma2 family endonuclease [Streptomyces sp. DSM 40750]|uniref:Uma2 family endonuclease n=1 Tax=Streptomyces sp. DSM 40750 TaxID=2801030 RepID=UPI00214AB818|nr:Uma2 family endonuclease [Streptomyces sp. DSM 40750]UUU23028.1 Uma2 family endonuclease [Streptomyces sp. DSM 40750]
MTVLDDRIEMAEGSRELTLDVMFECLEKMPIPEGTKVEIVGGNIFMSPQRQTHFEIIFDILVQMRDKYTPKRLASDVRIDFPGELNGFACDVAAVADRSVKDSSGRWRYQDIEFVAEVISKGTAANDYGPKKLAYAVAEVPVYLIADPYQGRCHIYTHPKDGDYATETKIPFGDDVDLAGTVVGLTLKTDEFPRD